MKRLAKWGCYAVAAAIVLTAAVLILFSWQAHRREVIPAREAAPASGRYVNAADVAIFVQESGPADGPAVLFVHGTGAWSETWRESMSILARAGYRAIGIDLPPFGYSQRPARPSYAKQDQGRRIVGVLDALKITRVILVGHSFGAGPTVEAALLAPRQVRGLVLVDAALAIRADGGAPEPVSPLLNALLAVVPLRNAVVATFLTNPGFTRKLLQGFIDDPARATDERVVVYQRPLVVEGTTQAVGEWLPALLAPASVSASEDPASYKSLRMPVFAIWGDRDTITPLEQGKRLAGITPKAELLVVNGVGHIPQIEDPARFQELLLACVGKLK
ncbi:MAG TPA: alpha/beta hydrolase [Burkholderiales bacterium]|nr:alpha/beta hydrolase [Burkholderiales bacterium]